MSRAARPKGQVAFGLGVHGDVRVEAEVGRTTLSLDLAPVRVSATTKRAAALSLAGEAEQLAAFLTQVAEAVREMATGADSLEELFSGYRFRVL